MLRRVLILLLAATAVVTTTAATARADDWSEDVKVMRAYMTQYGVDRSTQNRVIEKVLSGRIPDSDAGQPPVKVVESSDGQDITRVSTYADGSISVSVVSDLQAAQGRAEAGGEISPFRVYGCEFTGSTYAGYWNDCVAEERTTLLFLAFRFSYQNVQGVGAKITSKCCAEHVAVGGSFIEGALTQPRSTVVRYSGTFVLYGGAGSFTRWMQVTVSGNNATTSRNW